MALGDLFDESIISHTAFYIGLFPGLLIKITVHEKDPVGEVERASQLSCYDGCCVSAQDLESASMHSFIYSVQSLLCARSC